MSSESGLLVRIVSVTVLGFVAGTLASLAAIVFVDAISPMNDWLFVSPRSRFMAADTDLLVVATLCIPAFGGLVVGLIHLKMPGRRAEGPQDIIEVVHTSRSRMPLKSGLLSALSSLV